MLRDSLLGRGKALALLGLLAEGWLGAARPQQGDRLPGPFPDLVTGPATRAIDPR